MNFRVELIRCGVYSLVALMGAAAFVLSMDLHEHLTLLVGLWLTLAVVNFSLVFLVFVLLQRSAENALTRLAFGVTPIKLILVAGIFGLYFLQNPDMSRLYVFPYFWIYLIYTIYEVKLFMYKSSL